MTDSGMTYMVIAYSLVFAVIFGYTLSLGSRMGKIEREIEALKQAQKK